MLKFYLAVAFWFLHFFTSEETGRIGKENERSLLTFLRLYKINFGYINHIVSH